MPGGIVAEADLGIRLEGEQVRLELPHLLVERDHPLPCVPARRHAAEVGEAHAAVDEQDVVQPGQLRGRRLLGEALAGLEPEERRHPFAFAVAIHDFDAALDGVDLAGRVGASLGKAEERIAVDGQRIAREALQTIGERPVGGEVVVDAVEHVGIGELVADGDVVDLAVGLLVVGREPDEAPGVAVGLRGVRRRRATGTRHVERHGVDPELFAVREERQPLVRGAPVADEADEVEAGFLVVLQLRAPVARDEDAVGQERFAVEIQSAVEPVDLDFGGIRRMADELGRSARQLLAGAVEKPAVEIEDVPRRGPGQGDRHKLAAAFRSGCDRLLRQDLRIAGHAQRQGQFRVLRQRARGFDPDGDARLRLVGVVGILRVEAQRMRHVDELADLLDRPAIGVGEEQRDAAPRGGELDAAERERRRLARPMLEGGAAHLRRLPLLLDAGRHVDALGLQGGAGRRDGEREPRIGAALGGERESGDVQGRGVGAQQHVAEILGFEEADVHRRPGEALLRSRRVVAADVHAQRAEPGQGRRVGKGGERNGHFRRPFALAHPRRHAPVRLPLPFVEAAEIAEVELRALGVEDELVERIADAQDVQEDFDGVAQPARAAGIAADEVQIERMRVVGDADARGHRRGRPHVVVHHDGGNVLPDRVVRQTVQRRRRGGGRGEPHHRRLGRSGAGMHDGLRQRGAGVVPGGPERRGGGPRLDLDGVHPDLPRIQRHDVDRNRAMRIRVQAQFVSRPFRPRGHDRLRLERLRVTRRHREAHLPACMLPAEVDRHHVVPAFRNIHGHAQQMERTLDAHRPATMHGVRPVQEELLAELPEARLVADLHGEAVGPVEPPGPRPRIRNVGIRRVFEAPVDLEVLRSVRVGRGRARRRQSQHF